MRLRLAQEESGYTMIAVVGAMALISMLVGGSLAATNSDLNLTRRDLDRKRAYAAAQAGIADYSFHLNNDNSYWAKCTTVPSPHAVNQQGSTANQRTVPGTTNATYALQLIPASSGGHSTCSTTEPVASMLESGAVNTGSFRIRSIGNAGQASVRIVATFKRASLLDYVYFTQLETSDPVTYGYPNPSAALTGANTQCSKFRREGRMSAPIPGSNPTNYCDQIVFVSGDHIDGPLHTNDDLLICGSPTFGRTAADVTEVSAGLPGWSYGGCGGGASPQFVGPLVTTAPVLTPPPTNGSLKTIAGTNYTYYGQTSITLSGGNMTVTSSAGTVGPIPVPAQGVVYVENHPTNPCSGSYSPFTATYPSSSGCGTVRVSGSYSGLLTIAARNDVIIWDDITRTGNGMLGLIADNFVRVRHPFSDTNDTVRGQCDGGSNQSGTQTNLRVDAALLAIQHSFIVDHYDCGASLGELEVNGAISQKFRGAVGTTGGTGYLKDYNYDDRLRYQEPPHFLDPVESAWHIQRETLDFP
jgi:Tfp pilus assembly protein PilX